MPTPGRSELKWPGRRSLRCPKRGGKTCLTGCFASRAASMQSPSGTGPETGGIAGHRSHDRPCLRASETEPEHPYSASRKRGGDVSVSAGRNKERAGNSLSEQERPKQPTDRAPRRLSRSERLSARLPEVDRNESPGLEGETPLDTGGAPATCALHVRRHTGAATTVNVGIAVCSSSIQ